MCAGNPDFPFFQRLAQHFQYRFAKLRQFIQKQNASMRQRDLSRRRDQSASGQRRSLSAYGAALRNGRVLVTMRLLTVGSEGLTTLFNFCDLQTFLQRQAAAGSSGSCGKAWSCRSPGDPGSADYAAPATAASAARLAAFCPCSSAKSTG